MKSEKAFTLIELMVVVVIIGILAAIAIPNFLRMQRRAKESDVKSVAHSLLLSIEDYKISPTWMGQKPSIPAELIVVQQSYLTVAVQCKQNPFSPGNYYGGSEIMFGAPAPGNLGRVGYIYVAPNQPYTISAMGGENGLIVLTLSAES